MGDDIVQLASEEAGVPSSTLGPGTQIKPKTPPMGGVFGLGQFNFVYLLVRKPFSLPQFPKEILYKRLFCHHPFF